MVQMYCILPGTVTNLSNVLSVTLYHSSDVPRARILNVILHVFAGFYSCTHNFISMFILTLVQIESIFKVLEKKKYFKSL